jgi:hypothetical protein
MYVLGYTVSTPTVALSGRYKNFESIPLSKFLYRPDDDPVTVETVQPSTYNISLYL